MKIKYLFLFNLFLFAFSQLKAQSNNEKCGVKIQDIKSQNVLGRNIGYVVKFDNDNEKTIDGIAWTAFYYDRFGELKGKKEGTWTSGNFIKPVPTNSTLTTTQTSWVKDADDVFITINKVHFTDGSTCK